MMQRAIFEIPPHTKGHEMTEIALYRQLALVNIAVALAIESRRSAIDALSSKSSNELDSNSIEYDYGSGNRIIMSYTTHRTVQQRVQEMFYKSAPYMILRQEFVCVSKSIDIHRTGKRRLHASIDHLGITKIYRFEDGPWAYELLQIAHQ
jgi:hypothetical protein